MRTPERHPLNADGDFFVENGLCTACDASPSEAPELIEYDENFHCYFKRQPVTPEEVEHAVRAIYVSCCEGVLYGGQDPVILRRLQTIAHEFPPLSKEELRKIMGEPPPLRERIIKAVKEFLGLSAEK
jgi:hypothetical protein